MSIELVMPSNHLILCRPLLLSIFPRIRDFSNESILRSGGQSIGASASSSALPKNIQDFSFRIDWFDLLTVQGILKSLLQHHISKTSMLRCSAFFMVQLSYPYMTIGKTIRSDQISRSVVSDSLRPHESQHARPPCPSPTPGVH